MHYFGNFKICRLLETHDKLASGQRLHLDLSEIMNEYHGDENLPLGKANKVRRHGEKKRHRENGTVRCLCMYFVYA